MCLIKATAKYAKQLSRNKKARKLHISSDENIVIDFNKKYTRTGFGKPPGFWYGLNESWLEWCAAESFGLDSFVHELIVDDSNILKIDSLEKFNEFEEEHGFDYFKKIGAYNFHLDEVCYDKIDYTKVIEKYSGIEIAPYQWEKRLNSLWYYGWDAASGCIWNLDIIKEVKLVAYYDDRQDKFVKI